MNNKFYCDSGCTSHAHISLDSIRMGSEYYTDLGTIFEEINSEMSTLQDYVSSRNNVVLYWQKVVPNANIPTKRLEDAGFDIYTIDDHVTLKPFETKKFSTGLRCAFDKGYWMEIKERGSTGSLGLSVRAGVVDSGYRGELIIVLTNLNPYPIEFTSDVKEVTTAYYKWWFLKDKVAKVYYPVSKAIAQAVLVPLPTVFCRPWDESKIAASERGESGFGASGK